MLLTSPSRDICGASDPDGASETNAGDLFMEEDMVVDEVEEAVDAPEPE